MKFSEPVFVVEARRTPLGRFGGCLASLSSIDLVTQLGDVVAPAKLRSHIDEVVLGQVLQAGAGLNPARQLGLRLGVRQSSPAYTVNMACASGMKAIALAASSIHSGESSIALAGGVESMSRAPYYATQTRWGHKLGDTSLTDALNADALTDPLLRLTMGETAERIAKAYNISREAQDEFALSSQRRAALSKAELQREIVPVQTPTLVVAQDETPRPDTTLENLGKLKPIFRPDGTVTPGNASGINDGAALLLIARSDATRRYGLRPRVRIVGAAAVGCDPAMMGLGPVKAIHHLCEEIGWQLSSVNAVEINEAFAVQTLACARELGLNLENLNQRGGAIALGHPIGCSGARVLVTLIHLLEDKGYKRGIAAVCVGGGMGMAMALEIG